MIRFPKLARLACLLFLLFTLSHRLGLGSVEFPHRPAADPPPGVSSIAPGRGPTSGGTVVTVTGTNFTVGASVSIGGVAGTSVTVISPTSLMATTGAHATGAVDVVVRNPDGQSAALRNGFQYESSGFNGDVDGDSTVTVADVFYLINHLFTNGPPLLGRGDVNGDGAVNVADVFHLISFLFAGGPPPCTPATGSVNITATSLTVGQTSNISITANGPWTLSSDLGNGLSATSGSGNASVTYTATNTGTDTVRLNVTTSCGTVPFTDTVVVTAACTPATGSVNITATSLTVGQTSNISITANGPWTLSSDLGNGLSATSGTGNASVTYTATNTGTDTVRLNVTTSCGTVPFTDSVVVTCPVPTGSIAATPSSISQGATSSLTITASGTWTLTSSLGNGRSATSGSGNATVTYTGTNAGTDTLTLVITNSCGSQTTRTTTVTVNAVCNAPVISNLQSDKNPVGPAATANITFTVANATSWSVSSSLLNSLTPATGTGTNGSVVYRRSAALGADTITVTATGPCGTSSDSIIIN